MRLKQIVLGFFALFAFVTLFSILMPANAKAYTAEGHWTDRAHFEITRFTISQSEYDNQIDSKYRDNFDIDEVNALAQEQLVGTYTIHPDDRNNLSRPDNEIELGTTGTRLRYQNVDSQCKPEGQFGFAVYTSTDRDGSGRAAGTKLDAFIFDRPNIHTQFGEENCVDLFRGDGNKDKHFTCDIDIPDGNCDYEHQILFNWIAPNALVHVNGLDGQYTEDTPGTYTRDTAGSQDRIFINPDNDERTGEYLANNGGIRREVKIGDTDKRTGDPVERSNGAPPGEVGEDHSCESGAGATGWIICKVLELAGGTLNFLDSMIVGMLNVDESYLTNPATEEIWKRFRNIAYIILVPAFLVMVISTALGFEFISAYTVKKALPRLVIATMFIALSFEITKFLIILINNVGGGMLGLMSSAGGDTINNLQDLFEPGWFSGAGLLALLGAAGAGVVVAVGAGVFAGAVFSLIGFLGAAGIAILLILLLLGFRQVLIIALAILSPLAILSWIFPGNDKLWNLWKDSFIKLLLLYPVIMLTIGAGRMFAGMVGDVQGDAPMPEATLNTIIKLCAYVLPYFLIPFLFKSAGGLFANIAGMANNRQKGLMDRSKNWGKGRREEVQSFRKEASRANRLDKYRRGHVARGPRGPLGVEDLAVMQAQSDQFANRRQEAQLKSIELKNRAATLDVQATVEQDIKGLINTDRLDDRGNVMRDAAGNALKHDTYTARRQVLSNVATNLNERLSAGTATESEVIGTLNALAIQKSEGNIAKIQDHIVGMEGDANGEQAAQHWAAALANNDAYSGMSKLSPALVSVGVGPGGSHIDPTTGNTVSNRNMPAERAEAFLATKETEKLMGASGEAWQEAYDHLKTLGREKELTDRWDQIYKQGGEAAVKLQWKKP